MKITHIRKDGYESQAMYFSRIDDEADYLLGLGQEAVELS
jgi:hypothetical protein